jgi:alpha/beta superfamily hydrolase
MRAVTIPGLAGHPAIEGVWLTEGARVAVVAPPHPLMGGQWSNPVVQALAEGFANAGLGVLVFNYRGVGESEGEASGDHEDAKADYAGALAHAGEKATVVVVSGYSFGGAAAVHLGAAHASFRVLAVAPPPGLLPPAVVSSLSGRCTIVAGERDPIAAAEDLAGIVAASRDVDLVTVPAADHFFVRQLGKIRDVAVRTAESLKAGER